MHDALTAVLLAAATPTPTPSPVDPNLVTPGPWGFVVIVFLAIAGILFRVFWINAPRWLYVALYLVLGWAAVMYLPQLWAANQVMVILIAIGGVLYTVGAVAYAMKRPNPWPGHFGFHEIFHVCTVLAFLCHWTACLLIALNPAYHG